MATLSKQSKYPSGLSGLTLSDGTQVTATSLDTGGITTATLGDGSKTISIVGPPGKGAVTVSTQKLVTGTQQAAAEVISDTTDSPNFLTSSQGLIYQGPAAGYSLMEGTGGTAPTFVSVSPTNGSTAGGTPVTVTGNGFITGAEVTFGGNPATSVVVVDSQHITCTTPAGSVGATDIEVITSTGSVDAPDAWTYTAAAPTISSVTGSDGAPRAPVLGSTHSAVIQGTGFVNGCTVTFGGVSSIVSFISSTEIFAQPPAHAAGVVDIVVTNPDLLTATAPNSWTYIGSGGARQTDSTQFVAPGTTLSNTYFEDFYPPFLRVAAGDTLIAVITANGLNEAGVSTMNVTSITDNYGNTWVQVPGARNAASVSSGFFNNFIDCWVAYDVAAVDIGTTGNIQVNVSTDTSFVGHSDAVASVAIYDVAAGVLSGATPTVETASGATAASFSGPSIDCGSGAFVFSAYSCSTTAGYALDVAPSPWVPWTSVTGIALDTDLANATTSGAQTPTFTIPSDIAGSPYVLSSVAFPTT